MSHENVANIDRAYQAVSRFAAEALVALCEPDVGFRSRVGDADAVTYRGHDGLRDYIATLSEVFEWVLTEPLEVIDEGDRAVVCNRFQGRGRLSEVEIENHFFHAMRIRNGKARKGAVAQVTTSAAETSDWRRADRCRRPHRGAMRLGQNASSLALTPVDCLQT